MRQFLITKTFLAILSAIVSASASELKTGQPHSTVQTLTTDNFETALNDPANGLWLLKFYAPWCGHCKKLAPTLDKMAPYIAGKLSIGKIDCTVEQDLCKQYEVRGYPTLKIYRDGDFFDYPGKRDADSMIEFAEKMSRPAVKLVNSGEEFEEGVLGKSENGVAFLVFDDKAKEVKSSDGKGRTSEELTTVEKYLASTTATQVFGQVARKLQDRGNFGLLHPSAKKDLQKLGLAGKMKGPLIAKIEKDADPVVYTGELNSMDLLDFIKENNVALVTNLEGRNFRSVAHLGKPLFIGVVNPTDSKRIDEMISFKASLREFAKNGDEKDNYVFATMDGSKWSNFLKQFSISPSQLPQFLVLDVPKRMYFQNETFVDIYSFVKGMKDGTIEEREQVSNSGDGPLEKFHAFFVKFMPYTLLAMVAIFGIIIFVLLNDDEDEIRYQEMLKAQRERAKKNKAQPKVKPIKED